MARARRLTTTRTAKKKSAAARRPVARRTPQGVSAAAAPPQRSVTPALPARKPGYYDAIAIYESGVRALQKHEFAPAADHFRNVLQRYPDERELAERARLYLRVCERETARRPAGPKTPDERIYAATVALNAGDPTAAVRHLEQALADRPDSDSGHYFMAVALSEKGRSEAALDHLRRAITLNPENRTLARQDPDLGALRDLEEFREMLDSTDAGPRRRTRPRTGMRP